MEFTREQLQDLLRPPPNSNPTIVTVEDHNIEEYEEPPVLGKRSIFVARSTGVMEQWTQCDCCTKWRRLPFEVLLPPTWSCVENVWDQSRSSCSAPCELSPSELENLVRVDRDVMHR